MTSSRPYAGSNLDDLLSSENPERIDDVVDNLLRDGDFLLAHEIRHRIEELNRLFAQASDQSLRIELRTSEQTSESQTPLCRLDVTVLKEL